VDWARARIRADFDPGGAVGQGSANRNGNDGTVTRFDPKTADVKHIEVGGTPTDLAAGAGGVWVAVKAT